MAWHNPALPTDNHARQEEAGVFAVNDRFDKTAAEYKRLERVVACFSSFQLIVATAHSP